MDKDSASNAADQAVVRRAQQGDAEAVRQLFGQHLGTVHRFALRMCRDEERARDIAQESLLTALKSLDSYRGDASFATWLFTIARSHCGKLRRRAEREPVGQDSDAQADTAASQAPLPDDQAMQAQITLVLETALASLEPDEREVVLLRDVEGLSTREAADVLGLSVAALKSRLHRARAALRERVRALADNKPETTTPSCPDILQEFSKKLEGDLAAGACSRLEAHVAKCPACASRCKSIQQVLGACASLRERPSSPELQRVLEQAVAQYRQLRPST